MVKIINQAGDIKTGVQGRVVYQRKYGVQIRRMREPKRAIPSETQIRHRQLYKAALTWRKSLSLANRRFLEGYAISNWIVDDHHQPLPWHRLALKLYLEHVHFNILTMPTAGESGDWQKFESNEGGDNSWTYFFGNWWTGQGFTPTQSHILDRFTPKLFRQGDCAYTGYCTIYLAGGDHLPTGAPLGQGTFTPNDVPLVTPTWIDISLPNIAVTQNTEYVAMLHMSGGTSTKRLKWRYVTSGNPYAGGIVVVSADGGSSFIPDADRDTQFKEYGTLAGTPGQSGEIEIRHPAIQTITRKHEGVVIPQFDTMSSLDGERLTNILNLAANIDDEIKVTTVCGLTTKYQL